MLFEFLSHLISLDFGWIVNLLLTNLHWVFATVVLSYFFAEGKKVLALFFIFVFWVWAFFDFVPIIGIGVIGGAFLGWYYVYRMSTVIFMESDKKLSKNLLSWMEISFWVFVIGYTVFTVG